jgi:hypothetical protein
LFSREGEDRQDLDHDLGQYFGHCGCRRNLGVNHETSEEILDAFKDVDEGVVACPHILGRLVDPDITKSQLGKVGRIHTESRIPMPAKIALAGGNT